MTVPSTIPITQPLASAGLPGSMFCWGGRCRKLHLELWKEIDGGIKLWRTLVYVSGVVKAGQSGWLDGGGISVVVSLARR